ncbi:uroporphyrinogen-III synthase [Neolewinella xylanilytica]|uniref:Uroporphyrinogen-III synthase n=1 Tax=Neolewinella xylanilytica TaxID=1514080 RepID=A0A2S6I4B6_9BACT|nr:uroporphyrinogen-III synthase [Neolewinella xylanilytica]PPK85993.1 uroporphyrinogen-III synthase [Neolewinella xylanilytica]
MAVFISRNLKADSPLLAWGRARGISVHGHSFLRFEAVAFDPPEVADWWFFYSSRAVQFAAASVPKNTKTAAIGSGTAQALLDRALTVDFCGAGSPAVVADDFLAVSAGRRVFFPRARQSRLSVQKKLADRATVLDAVCYDNVPVPPPGPIDADAYIFTSPLNVAAYLDHFHLRSGARVLAIGPSTGAALRERGYSCEWPAVASETALVDLLR